MIYYTNGVQWYNLVKHGIGLISKKFLICLKSEEQKIIQLHLIFFFKQKIIQLQLINVDLLNLCTKQSILRMRKSLS